uniref:Regulatory protein zeste n=1 Tax=Timema bartmani TaxID=61472 RepID=A0A7R9EPJ0_9NEOP|nr:unnamed protein product [Timema bartmani]
MDDDRVFDDDQVDLVEVIGVIDKLPEFKRYLRDAENSVEFYSDSEFIRRFRLSKDTMVNVIFPLLTGSTHDARIFSNSRVKTRLETRQVRSNILGESGYPHLDYLYTPVPDPQTPEERQYNTIDKESVGVSHLRILNDPWNKFMYGMCVPTSEGKSSGPLTSSAISAMNIDLVLYLNTGRDFPVCIAALYLSISNSFPPTPHGVCLQHDPASAPAHHAALVQSGPCTIARDYRLGNTARKKSLVVNMEDVKQTYDRFTTNEREILFSLIHSKSAVIEDKRTSFSVLMAKKKAWQDIADGFNSYADVTHLANALLVLSSTAEDGEIKVRISRSAPHLEKYWESEKARGKKFLTAESQRKRATGGEPFTPGESTDSELEAILSTPIAYTVEGADPCDTILPPTPRPEESSATQSPPEAAIPTFYGNSSSSVLVVTLPLDTIPNALHITASCHTEVPASSSTVNTPVSSKLSKGVAIERVVEQRLNRAAANSLKEKHLFRLRGREQRLRIQAARLKCAQLRAENERSARMEKEILKAAVQAEAHKQQLHNQLMNHQKQLFENQNELHKKLMLREKQKLEQQNELHKLLMEQKKEHELKLKLLQDTGINGI